MIKKKIAIITLASALTLASMAGLTACGNMDLWDTNYTLRYAVLEENGHDVLHTIESWSDSESDSAMFRTSCCGNYIWTSVNKAVLYESKPSSDAYDYECGGHE